MVTDNTFHGVHFYTQSRAECSKQSWKSPQFVLETFRNRPRILLTRNARCTKEVEGQWVTRLVAHVAVILWHQFHRLMGIREPSHWHVVRSSFQLQKVGGTQFRFRETVLQQQVEIALFQWSPGGRVSPSLQFFCLIFEWYLGNWNSWSVWMAFPSYHRAVGEYSNFVVNVISPRCVV